MTENQNVFAVGDTVHLTAQYGAHRGFEPGDPAKVTKVFDPSHTGSGVGLHIDSTGDLLWDAAWWAPAPPVASPPPVASLRHDTSKQYAMNARSPKLLSADHNDILHRAAAGEEVDVVEFRKAATSALSAASTRHGQSMGRREYAKEARHLIYWADAIIDQHVKGLPIYEAGARSPRIAELEAEVARLTNEGSPKVKKALRDATDALDHITRQRDSIQGAFANYKAAADAEITRLNKAVREHADVAKEAIDSAERLGSVLIYAVTTVIDDEAEVARVFGYWDGIEDGA